ncbi:putative MULE transposase domain-containing protein 7, partial [Homarus americanus]
SQAGHNHAADETNVQYYKCRNQMRHQAASSLDKPGNIVAQAVTQQNKASLRDFTLPDEWKKTLGSSPEQFLLYDSGPEANSLIIAFATKESLHRLAAAETIFMDGTFKTAPTQFTQVYVLRVPFSTTYVSCVYALMQNKTRAVYSELFDAIVDHCTELGLNLQVRTVVTDFEVQSKGCFTT